jgi:hypothetical protein
MMNTGTQDARQEGAWGKAVKRPALIFSTCTMADCPLEAVCITKQENGRDVKCGYFVDSLTYGSGSQVVCGYGGN